MTEKLKRKHLQTIEHVDESVYECKHGTHFGFLRLLIWIRECGMLKLLTRSELRVLMVLMCYCKVSGVKYITRCLQIRIAHYTGLRQSHVSRAIEGLVRKGVIRLVRNSAHHRSAVYQFCMEQ